MPVVNVVPGDLRLGNTVVPPFLPPHPGGAPLATVTRRTPPPPRFSPPGEAAEGAGARGFDGTKVKGEGGMRPNFSEPSRGPWRALRAQSRKAGFCTSSWGDFGFRGFLESSFLFWETEGPRLPMLD